MESRSTKRRGSQAYHRIQVREATAIRAVVASAPRPGLEANDGEARSDAGVLEVAENGGGELKIEEEVADVEGYQPEARSRGASLANQSHGG